MADVKIRVLTENRSSKELSKIDKGLKTLAAGIAAATAAAIAMKKAFDFAKQGAAIERLQESGQRLASQFDQDMDTIVDSIVRASGNTIDRMTAMQAANNAMVLDVAKSPEEFDKLTKAAVALGRATGRDAAQSIQDLTTGVGRQSRMILDNLGIVVEAEKDYAAYAAQLGKTAEELTDSERKQALLNKAIQASQPLLDSQGNLIGDAASEFERFSANIQDSKDSLKELAVDAFEPALEMFNDWMDSNEDYERIAEESLSSTKDLEGAYREYARRIGDAAAASGDMTRADADRLENALLLNDSLEDMNFYQRILIKDTNALTSAEFEGARIAAKYADEARGLSTELEGASNRAAEVDFDATSFEIDMAGAVEIAEDLKNEILGVNEALALTPELAALRAERIAKFSNQGVVIGTTGILGGTAQEKAANPGAFAPLPDNQRRGPRGGFQSGFAGGGMLGSTGSVAKVGEEGFEFAFQDQDGNWHIVPHDQSRRLEQMGLSADFGRVFGGPLGGGGRGGPADPFIPSSGGVKVPGGGFSTPVPANTLTGTQNFVPSSQESGGRLSPASTQQAVAQAATSAAAAVGQQSVATQMTASAQQSQQFLNEFRSQIAGDRQEFTELLNKLDVRLDRLPKDIRDVILTVAQ